MSTKFYFSDARPSAPGAIHIEFDTTALDMLITHPFDNSTETQTRVFLSLMTFRTNKRIFCFEVTGSLPSIADPLKHLSFTISPNHFDSKLFVIHGSRSMLAEQLVDKYFRHSLFIDKTGTPFGPTMIERNLRQISTSLKLPQKTSKEPQATSLKDITNFIKGSLAQSRGS